MYTFFALIYTAGNVEGDLVMLLATYRNLIILALILTPLTYLFRQVRFNLNNPKLNISKGT
jgi:hypothetical protein